MERNEKIMDQESFFEKYPKSKNYFESSTLTWNNLCEIYDDYLNYQKELEDTLNIVTNVLKKSKGVHSIRSRIKNGEHLIEKIIRQHDEYDNINKENYKDKVKDLIGIRVLHLFKDDWVLIHDFITQTWKLKNDERPTAHYREGDDEEYLTQLQDKDCKLKKHPAGYRSIHYIIESQGMKNIHIAEIQVRTIFEEAWSEIDHNIRYPYHTDDKQLLKYSSHINRIAGVADEMATFIKYYIDRMYTSSIKEPRLHLEATGFTNVIFHDNFESKKEWCDFKNGKLEYSSEQAYEGKYSLKKTSHNDPNGGFYKLDRHYDPKLIFTGYLYRPQITDGEKGGLADRLSLLNENNNGYGFFINHKRGKISIESRTASKATIISANNDIPPEYELLLDQWFNFKFIISNEFVSLYLYDKIDKRIASLENVSYSDYKSFDRIGIHGGYPYYIDKIFLYYE